MLSAQTVSRLADALKEEVIEEIYQSERYNEVMQELIGEAMEKKLGKCDEDLFFWDRDVSYGQDWAEIELLTSKGPL